VEGREDDGTDEEDEEALEDDDVLAVLSLSNIRRS